MILVRKKMPKFTLLDVKLGIFFKILIFNILVELEDLTPEPL